MGADLDLIPAPHPVPQAPVKVSKPGEISEFHKYHSTRCGPKQKGKKSLSESIDIKALASHPTDTVQIPGTVDEPLSTLRVTPEQRAQTLEHH